MVNSDINKNSIYNPQENPGDWRICINSNLRRWFSRNLGLWRSRRQYFFNDEDALHVDMLLKIEKIPDLQSEDSRYRFTWWSEKEYDFFERKPNYSKQGNLEISLLGHQLHRNKGYFSDCSNISSIRQVDEHELIFESRYEDWDIQENTRLIDQDNFRSRNIYSWKNNKLAIVENHHEIRIEN